MRAWAQGCHLRVPLVCWPQLMLRVLGKILYWIAVLAVSVVLLVLLVRFFESRDESELEGSRAAPPGLTA